jgi:hypothetical protein
MVASGNFEMTVGSKAQVWHGKAKHTSGGLTRKDLMKTKAGRIVSRKKHAAGKKAIQRLFKLGFKPRKGTFRLMSSSGRSRTRKTRRSTGGSAQENLMRGNVGAALADALSGRF